MLQHARRISGNVSHTGQFFAVSRAFYYIWRKRYKKHGVAGSGIVASPPDGIKPRPHFSELADLIGAPISIFSLQAARTSFTQ